MTTVSFSPEQHRFGKLCKRGHGYEDTGKSLRFKSNGSCVMCVRESSAQYHQEHKDEIHARAKGWRAENKEFLREKMKGYEKQYGKTKRGQEVRLRARRSRKAEGRDKITRDKYRRTKKGRESQRRCNARWRMRKAEQAGEVTQNYKDAMLEALDHCCPVCGIRFHMGPERVPEQLTWDHVVPLSEDGCDDDANLLPLCRRCNCTKGERGFEIWLQRPIRCIADLWEPWLREEMFGGWHDEVL